MCGYFSAVFDLLGGSYVDFTSIGEASNNAVDYPDGYVLKHSIMTRLATGNKSFVSGDFSCDEVSAI